MGLLDKIKEIELEIKRTQKNKATNSHLMSLRARLAKLRTEVLTGTGGSAGGNSAERGFEVAKSGDGRVALIGFPSVGKSSLLSTLTETKSEVAGYEFTTLTAIPGNILYNDAKIQMLDLPGIIEGAAYGKGRGRQVVACAKTADLILIVLDAGKEGIEIDHKGILENELYLCGIRLNTKRPDVTFDIKKTGGIKFNATVPLTKLGPDPQQSVKNILHEYKIHNANILFREDCTGEQLIDLIEGNRKYVRCLYVYNKIDVCTIEEVDVMARRPHSLVIGVHDELNLQYLLKKIWEYMSLVRVYTKRKGEAPDLTEPVVISNERTGGCTVKHLCTHLHHELVDDFKFALVWGRSVKHTPQRVGFQHKLRDEDIIQITKKTSNEMKQEKDYNKRVQASFDKYKEKKKKAKKRQPG
tara:strand:- start:504 stop:1742 length:1239 start_codon:yes stop_codon:yes gene_type:complete